VNNIHRNSQDTLQTDDGIQVKPPTLNEIKEAIKVEKSHRLLAKMESQLECSSSSPCLSGQSTQGTMFTEDQVQQVRTTRLLALAISGGTANSSRYLAVTSEQTEDLYML
jgi:hypothetical protein